MVDPSAMAIDGMMSTIWYCKILTRAPLPLADLRNSRVASGRAANAASLGAKTLKRCLKKTGSEMMAIENHHAITYSILTYGQSIRVGKVGADISGNNQFGPRGEIWCGNVNNRFVPKAREENLIDDMNNTVGGGNVRFNKGCVVDADTIVVRHIDSLFVDHCQSVTRSDKNSRRIQSSWSDMVCKKIGKMQLPFRCQELGEKRLIHCIESHVVGSKDTIIEQTKENTAKEKDAFG